jgi:hypothetical protein
MSEKPGATPPSTAMAAPLDDGSLALLMPKTISIALGAEPPPDAVGNTVFTHRYTLLNFFPVQIYEQLNPFGKFANFVRAPALACARRRRRRPRARSSGRPSARAQSVEHGARTRVRAKFGRAAVARDGLSTCRPSAAARRSPALSAACGRGGRRASDRRARAGRAAPRVCRRADPPPRPVC